MKLMPVFKELHGIIECKQSNQDKLEFSKVAVMFIDSLPVILCGVSGSTNAKMARIKIYLQSLHWLELSFSPDTSPILSLPDYLSRRAQDDIGKTQNSVSDCDLAKCMLFKTKICDTQHYKPSEFLFVIDSLMNLEKSQLPQNKENSFTLKGGKLIFELDKLVLGVQEGQQ